MVEADSELGNSKAILSATSHFNKFMWRVEADLQTIKHILHKINIVEFRVTHCNNLNVQNTPKRE